MDRPPLKIRYLDRSNDNRISIYPSTNLVEGNLNSEIKEQPKYDALCSACRSIEKKHVDYKMGVLTKLRRKKTERPATISDNLLSFIDRKISRKIEKEVFPQQMTKDYYDNKYVTFQELKEFLGYWEKAKKGKLRGYAKDQFPMHVDYWDVNVFDDSLQKCEISPRGLGFKCDRINTRFETSTDMFADACKLLSAIDTKNNGFLGKVARDFESIKTW